MKTRNLKNTLANASSVMVPLSIWGNLMRHEYEIEYRGIKIKCPSLDAMKKAVRELENQLPPETEPWLSHDFVEFTQRIQWQQKKLLEVLLNSGPSSDEELRTSLGLADNRVLAGVLSGVSKVALALDIDPRRVYKQTTTYKNGSPLREYSISLPFRKAALDHGWE
jgi:hypothetical protein